MSEPIESRISCILADAYRQTWNEIKCLSVIESTSISWENLAKMVSKQHWGQTQLL